MTNGERIQGLGNPLRIPFGTIVSFYFHTVLNLRSVFFQFSLRVQQLTEIKEKEEFLKVVIIFSSVSKQ